MTAAVTGSVIVRTQSSAASTLGWPAAVVVFTSKAAVVHGLAKITAKSCLGVPPTKVLPEAPMLLPILNATRASTAGSVMLLSVIQTRILALPRMST